jgi:hypothetical protein
MKTVLLLLSWWQAPRGQQVLVYPEAPDNVVAGQDDGPGADDPAA